VELTLGAVPPVRALLDHLEPALKPPLFSARSRDRLRALAPDLPPAGLLLLEYHLCSEPGRLDLSISEVAEFPPAFDGPLLRALKQPLFFEYDLDIERASPAVFAAYSRSTPADGNRLIALATELLGPLAPRAQALLRRGAVAQASSGAWVTHLGAMLSREGRPIRLNIGGPSAGALRRYATEIGCTPAARSALDALFALTENFDPRWILCVDMVDRPLPRIGLECYLPPEPERWDRLLGHLRAERLCTLAEAAAIGDWPGQSTLGAERPEPLRSLDALLGRGSGGAVLRSINHLKLVADDGDVHAKIYLAARYLRFDSRRSEISGPHRRQA
jgi:hypothetical protein